MGEPAGADRTHYEAESAEIVTLPPVLLARLASRASELATDALLPFVPQQVRVPV
ncbi:MAG: hypothetical protein GX609_02355 [Actinomycetales bacterium]|nr:hypothetical protein [Actinomycetales bacterium]